MFAVYMYKNIDMLKSRHYRRWNKESKSNNEYQQMHKHMLSKQKHWKTIGLNPLSPQWSRQAVDTGEKSLVFLFPWSRPPFEKSFLLSWKRCVKNVCVCVCGNTCVCKWAQIWSRHQPWEIWGLIGHLCLIDFILFRHLKKNGLEPKMGSGVWLCMGKVLGTPRHPLKETVTSFLVFPYVC